MANLQKLTDAQIGAMQEKKIPGYTNKWSAIDGVIVGKKEYYLMENDTWGDETCYLVVSPDFKEIYETYDDIETCLQDENIIHGAPYLFYEPSDEENEIAEYLRRVRMGQGYVMLDQIEADIKEDPTYKLLEVDNIINYALQDNWTVKRLPGGFALVQKSTLRESLKEDSEKDQEFKLHKSMADISGSLDEGVKDFVKRTGNKIKDAIENKTYIFNTNAVNKHDVKFNNAKSAMDDAEKEKLNAKAARVKATGQKGAYAAQLKKQAHDLDNQTDHSDLADIEKRQTTLNKYQQASRDQEDAKKTQAKMTAKADKEREKAIKALAKRQEITDKMDKNWENTLRRYGLKEGLNTEDTQKFFDVAKEIGLYTVEDIDKFLKDQQQPGETAFETICRYRDELGPDYYNKDASVDDDFTYDFIL